MLIDGEYFPEKIYGVKYGKDEPLFFPDWAPDDIYDLIENAYDENLVPVTLTLMVTPGIN